MWNDKLIASSLQPNRGSSALPPIAWVPSERLDLGFPPIAQFQIQPASLDVRLGNEFIEHPGQSVVDVPIGYRYALEPGRCLLACLVERICLPDDVVARIEGKSSWARHFLTVHSAGFIDPGFRGDITLELKNDGHSVLDIRPGDVIAQMSFQWLVAPAMRPYGSDGLGSHYQGQRGTTPSWQ